MNEIINVADVETLFKEQRELFDKYNFVLTDDYRKHTEKKICAVYFLQEENRFLVFIDEDKKDIVALMLKKYLMDNGPAKDAAENKIERETSDGQKEEGLPF